MGVRGIARDLAAAGAGKLVALKIEPVEGSGPSAVSVAISDRDGCPAFYGRSIRGLRNGPSPEWLQQRLRAAGQRPISAIVDITNYVMLDHGRPAHAYDIAKLKGGLTARAAKDGEEVLALNGKTYRLQPFMTVIADDFGVHDIGGIMGGEHSSVTEGTTDVFLEIAWFPPERIARTGQALGLTSDARTRFERGADPAFLDPGLDRVTDLILDICGGEASEAVRVGEPPTEQRIIAFDPARTAPIGGLDVPRRKVASLAVASRLSPAHRPTWRSDVDAPPIWSRSSRSSASILSSRLRSSADEGRRTTATVQLIERRVAAPRRPAGSMRRTWLHREAEARNSAWRVALLNTDSEK